VAPSGEPRGWLCAGPVSRRAIPEEVNPMLELKSVTLGESVVPPCNPEVKCQPYDLPCLPA